MKVRFCASFDYKSFLGWRDPLKPRTCPEYQSLGRTKKMKMSRTLQAHGFLVLTARVFMVRH